MFGKTEHLHFVGIGGIGMSGLAIIMRNLKFRVSGSDLHRSEITARLRRGGIKMYHNHVKENIAGSDVIVYSTAVRPDNPELTEGRRLGIPVIHRSELLAELTRMKTSICISGTHGKTTTTSIVGEVLIRAKMSPTTVIGGIIKGKSQAHFGRGDFLVCEADESDKSFLRLMPVYAVITNVEAEHLEYYRNIDEIREHFTFFANHVPFWGCVFLGADSVDAQAIRAGIRRRVITYGLSERSDLRATNIKPLSAGSRFSVRLGGKLIGSFALPLLGAHNISNAIGAIGVGLELGIKIKDIQIALENFKGVHRRIEKIGIVKKVMIFDDYGHHPTEVAVTLQTLRERYPKNRIVSVFQPHRFTRTYHLFDKFAIAFAHADLVMVTDIYPAHEIPIAGVNGAALARRIGREHDAVHYVPFSHIIASIRRRVKSGDIVVIQGAGDINRIASRLMRELR